MMDVIIITFRNNSLDVTRLGHPAPYPYQDDEDADSADVNSESIDGDTASGILAASAYKSARHYLLHKEAKLLLCHFFLGAILIYLSLRRHVGGGGPLFGSMASTIFRFMMDTILMDCLMQEQRPAGKAEKLVLGGGGPEHFFRMAFLAIFSLVSRKAIPATVDLDQSRSLWGCVYSILTYVFDVD